MGNILEDYFWSQLRFTPGPLPRRLIFVGLDSSGKTEILCKLAKVDRPPNVNFGCNSEYIHYKGESFSVWDLKGNYESRKLWNSYIRGVDVAIFVIDSRDIHRMDEVKRYLFKFINEDEMIGIPLLIYANKQDYLDSLTSEELVEELELYNIPSTTSWFIQPSCALTGEGLEEGMNWIVSDCPNINIHPFRKAKSALSSKTIW